MQCNEIFVNLIPQKIAMQWNFREIDFTKNCHLLTYPNIQSPPAIAQANNPGLECVLVKIWLRQLGHWTWQGLGPTLNLLGPAWKATIAGGGGGGCPRSSVVWN